MFLRLHLYLQLEGVNPEGIQWRGPAFLLDHTTGAATRDILKSPEQVRFLPYSYLHAQWHIPSLPITPLTVASVPSVPGWPKDSGCSRAAPVLFQSCLWKVWAQLGTVAAASSFPLPAWSPGVFSTSPGAGTGSGNPPAAIAAVPN